MSVDHRRAWSEFWAQNKQAGFGGCLPERWQGIADAQRSAWQAFAARLPKGARVLDLATGDGRVLRWLRTARRDLKLEGVDLADELPAPPKGIKVRPGVAMERLPLPDRRFAAVVSQFGFEYANLAKAASETHRVLAAGGTVGLMTHRHDGPILAHNLARREQILWAIEERRLPAIARQALALRAAGVIAVPPAIAEAPTAGAARFGARSAAWEIAEAIRQCIVLGGRDHPARVTSLIDAVVLKARNELARIASLEAACAATADVEGFSEALAGAGLEQRAIEPVRESRDRPPFADFRTIVAR